jgi:hypothetical protein
MDEIWMKSVGGSTGSTSGTRVAYVTCRDPGHGRIFNVCRADGVLARHRDSLARPWMPSRRFGFPQDRRTHRYPLSQWSEWRACARRSGGALLVDLRGGPGSRTSPRTFTPGGWAGSRFLKTGLGLPPWSSRPGAGRRVPSPAYRSSDQLSQRRDNIQVPGLVFISRMPPGRSRLPPGSFFRPGPPDPTPMLESRSWNRP